MSDFLKKILILIITGGVFFGIPYLFGDWGNLTWSWVPALFVFGYLTNEDY